MTPPDLARPAARHVIRIVTPRPGESWTDLRSRVWELAQADGLSVLGVDLRWMTDGDVEGVVWVREP